VENPLFHLFLDHFPWVQPHYAIDFPHLC
jgi:hypothetical protein